MKRARTVAAGLVGLCLVVASAAWGVAAAATPSVPAEAAANGEATATVSALVAALNAHDVDEAMTFFGESAAVQDNRRPQSPEQIRGWLGQLARENLRLDLRGQPTVEPDQAHAGSQSVTWSAVLWWTLDRQLGAEHMNATVRALVLDRHLAFLSIRVDSGAAPRLAVAG